ncbi:hypothetical protein G9464_13580 [Halostella sp. JP-L12]|uniref:hypothetical protein n=1 Tax=Halostella TaxID=1843185 RepID=UPI000EF80817|nr:MULTISPECIES: hypothetical protein [Halostella]NHN48618.1 hypothetical protein [Halostella sp. JP-L12]
MRTNRRNLLIGLATATVGGGAAFGSGAFSQVEADRTVNISVTDDNNSSTLLQLSANADTALVTNDGNSSSELKFNLDNLNDNAVTTVAPAFTVTNNGGQNVAVRVRAMDTDNNSEVSAFSFTSNTNSHDMTTYPASGDDNNLTSGGSVTVDMEVDSDTGTPTNANVIRIEADESKYQA